MAYGKENLKPETFISPYCISYLLLYDKLPAKSSG